MRYPVFHKYITRVYLLIICVLIICIPISYSITRQPSIKYIIGIIVGVILSYVVYWLIVRLNCYGVPLQERRNTPPGIITTSNNNNNTNTIYVQPTLANNSISSHSGSSNANNHHPTFASYRLGGLTEIFRRFGSYTVNDDEISNETVDSLRPPPPTYNTALEGAGLPPPYMNDSDPQQMSERHPLPSVSSSSSLRHHPLPSVPSSSSLRHPVSLQQQQQQYTQSAQYTSQDPSSLIISDPSPQSPGHSVPHH